MQLVAPYDVCGGCVPRVGHDEPCLSHRFPAALHCHFSQFVVCVFLALHCHFLQFVVCVFLAFRNTNLCVMPHLRATLNFSSSRVA